MFSVGVLGLVSKARGAGILWQTETGKSGNLVGFSKGFQWFSAKVSADTYIYCLLTGTVLMTSDGVT